MREVTYLKRLEGDVLPTRQLDEVLGSVDERERSVRVELSDVSGPEVAIRCEGLLVKVRSLEVALEDRSSAEKDLSLRRVVRRQVAGLLVV